MTSSVFFLASAIQNERKKKKIIVVLFEGVAARLFETASGEYAPFGPVPYLEHLWQRRHRSQSVSARGARHDNDDDKESSPPRLMEAWEVVDVHNPYRYFRAPLDAWEREANACFFVEEPRDALSFFLLVHPGAARAAFAALSETQRRPFALLAQQDAERHAKALVARARFFVPGTDWPRQYNDGATVHVRCDSCFLLCGHLPECLVYGFPVAQQIPLWDRLLMSEEHFNAMLLLDVFLDQQKKGRPKLCQVREWEEETKTASLLIQTRLAIVLVFKSNWFPAVIQIVDRLFILTVFVPRLFMPPPTCPGLVWMRTRRSSVLSMSNARSATRSRHRRSS